MTYSRKAAVAFRALNGVACLYKPAQVSLNNVRSTLLSNLCRELNCMELEKPDKIVEIVGATNQPMQIRIKTNLACHPLVTGEPYQQSDVDCRIVPRFGPNTSGVCVVGFDEGALTIRRMYHAQLTKSYKLHGCLGTATDTYFINGKVVERATFKHVTRSKIDSVVSYIQSAHQRKMFELIGVDIQSQAAFDLASKGITRAADKNIPMLYGIKCVNFDPPNFVIEVQCMNEYEKYLQTLIHDIGIQLRTAAHCTAVQCIRYGKFTIDHALLKKHWSMKFILESIENSKKIIDTNLLYPEIHLK